jgi:hypothetical protein
VDQRSNDAALREAYRQLEERARAAEGADLEPELLAALAQGEISEPERSRLLDVVLADAVLLQEYELLRTLAADRPRQPATPRWFLLAASLLVLVGAGLLWRALAPARLDVVRGTTTDVVLVTPDADAVVSVGTRLVWRTVAGAVGYRTELVGADGQVAYETETTDTALVLPASLTPAREIAVSWVVSARMPGGNYLRSAPRKLGLRP